MSDYTDSGWYSPHRTHGAHADQAQPIEPLPEYDVEREFPWFVWGCVAAFAAGAVIPALVERL